MTYANTFDRNNAIFVFLIGALPAVAGSAISFLLGVAYVWAIISLVLGRFPFRLTRGDVYLCVTFTAFVAAVLATALIGENRAAIPAYTYWLLPFLSVWVIIPRLRASPGVDFLHCFIVGAAIGAIGGMLVGLAQVVVFDVRPAGGAGNAAIYGMMSLCLAVTAGLNINHGERNFRLLALAGLMAGLAAVILSLTRGVAMAAAPAMLLLLAYAPRAWRFSTRVAIIMLALVIVVLYAAADLLQLRAIETLEEVQRVLAGGSSENIGERLRLWAAGIKAIGESPIWGHGVQNRMSEVARHLAGDGLPIQAFTHAHNAFISSMLDGGVIVLAAVLAVLAVPTLIAWRAPPGPRHRKRLFLAAQVALVYATCGLSQIMFKHDIMDSFFIFTAVLVASSVASGGVDPEPAGQDGAKTS
ncbi:O-antigen ligase family protein [Mesorhizobium sp. CAU 1741]|uniref:O-antigen ligase family protein n=1 Tax=Mesorhizobium sp. CAU 1741 TaxID=3140366 RepID=UPI00325BF5B3